MAKIPTDRSRPCSRRVGLFIGSLNGGGAERVMQEIANELARRGLSVDMVLIRAEGPYLELLSEDVRVIELRTSRNIINIFLELLHYLRQERPDALLSSLDLTNVYALLAKRFFFRNIRLVVRQATTFSAFAEHGQMTLRDRVVQVLLKRLLPSADAVIAVSSGAAEDLSQNILGVSRLVHAVPNPVRVSKIAEKAELPVNHPWFGDGNVPVVLSVGRLSQEKDYATLLRAFAEVVRSRPARLVILGEGSERENLLELASRLGVSQRVALPGFDINPFAYMSKAGVFVLSSRYEGFPNTLAQAMACGVPVVSTDCRSGPREILEDGKWGPLVPVGDWRGMANAIVETLDDPLPAERLISRASVYSVEASVNRYLEVLIGGHGVNVECGPC